MFHSYDENNDPRPYEIYQVGAWYDTRPDRHYVLFMYVYNCWVSCYFDSGDDVAAAALWSGAAFVLGRMTSRR